MIFQRYLLLSDIHGNVDGIKRLLRARYDQRNKFDAIIISGDFPVTTPMFLVLRYMVKNFNLSRLGYSTKVYKQELRKVFVNYQISSIAKMMKYLSKFNLPIMFIPGNVETKDSVDFLQSNYQDVHFLDNNYLRFQDKINFFGLGGSLDHHGIVCDHEFPEGYFSHQSVLLDKKINSLDTKDPLVFIFHEPPYFMLAKADILKMQRKAKKRGYSYEFTDKAGSKDFLHLIKKFDPRLVLNGHFHEYQGVTEVGQSVIVNPGAMATYNYGIISLDASKAKTYKLEFFKIRPSPFNFTNFLYQKRNFITNKYSTHS